MHTMRYRWPTSGSQIWLAVQHGYEPTPFEQRCIWSHTENVHFAAGHYRDLALRKYRMMRQLGAPIAAARWAVATEIQRQLHTNAPTIPNTTMAWYPPDPDEDWIDDEPSY